MGADPPVGSGPIRKTSARLDPTVRDGRWYRADRKRSRIEERLGEIVIELEYRATVGRSGRTRFSGYSIVAAGPGMQG